MSVTEAKFSTKFEKAASEPEYRGAYYQEDATAKNMALVQVKFKDMKLYWLVDPVEDRVYSAKFFAYGGKVSLGMGETLCQMVKGLTIPEACSLTGNDVESSLRDNPDEPAVPENKLAAFSAVDELLKQVSENYPEAKALAQATSTAKEKAGEGDGESSMEKLSMMEQAWLALDPEQQIQQVNLVLDEKVRPALMADGGNVLVQKVIDNKKIIIQYQGACGSCGSSVGGTLAFIEQNLRNAIYNELVVVPDTYADMM